MKIPFGSKVKDINSGLVGIVVGYTQWQNGCNRYVIQPPVDKENKLPECHSIDEQQVALIKPAKKVEAKLSGGPKPTPKPF